MLNNKLVIVLDIDGTVCHNKKNNEEYCDVLPNIEVVEKIREYKQEHNAYIILFTSRQMRTF